MLEENHNLKILIVEDNIEFLRLANSMLDNYRCFTAKTAREALTLYQKERPDIIFLDIVLPDGSGHEVLEKIKQANHDAFVIMLTESRMAEDVQKSIKGGASGYIIKPFSRAQIRDYLAKYFTYIKQKQERIES